MTTLCSLPWCRKPIPTKRECRRFPEDRPSQLAWLDALDAGNWFSIPPETLSTGLFLCGSHFDESGNIKRRYEIPAPVATSSREAFYANVPVKVEREDSEEEFDDNEDAFLESEKGDPDFECGSRRSKRKPKERREIRVNIVHTKDDGNRSRKRSRTSMKMKFRSSDAELSDARDDINSLVGTGTVDKLASLTEDVFRKVKSETKTNRFGKNQRKSLSLGQKMEMIRMFDRGSKVTQIAKKMGLKMSTVSGVLSTRDRVEQAFNSGTSDLKKLRKSNFEDINQALFAWYQRLKSQNHNVNTKVLLTMAETIAKELGRTDFKGSTSWIDRFKQRYNIRFGATPQKKRRSPKKEPKISNESADADQNDQMQEYPEALNESCASESDNEEVEDERVAGARDWLNHIWEECKVKNPRTNELYSEKDVFFAEEIWILYRITPKIACQFRSSDEDGELPEFSINDERITVLFCSNSDGSEKRKLLIAGKEKTGIPANLPVDYVAAPHGSNKLLSSIFIDWLEDWNKSLEFEGRRILFLLQSAPIYRIKKKLSHITLVHIPMSYINQLSPAKFGITKGLRARYRRLLLKRFVSNGGNVAVSCCDALILLSTAWNELPPRLIRTAFIKAGFLKSTEKTLESYSEEFDCSNLLSKAAELGFAVSPSKFSFWDYVAIDDSLYATEFSSENPSPDKGTGESDDDEEDASEQLVEGKESYVAPIHCSLTETDAYNHLQNLRTWAMSRHTCPSQVHNALSTLESFILGHIN